MRRSGAFLCIQPTGPPKPANSGSVAGFAMACAADRPFLPRVGPIVFLAQTVQVAENGALSAVLAPDDRFHPLSAPLAHRQPCPLARISRDRARRDCARSTRVPGAVRCQFGRPFRRGSRRGRTYRRLALSLPDSRRPHRLGRRPPVLSAQDPDRPPRPHHHGEEEGRAGAVSASRGKRLRHLWRRPLLHVDQRCAGHGHRRAGQGRPAQDRRRDRRWRDDRRHGLRGAQSRRRRQAGHACHPQRQPDVDQRKRRRADQDAGPPHVQPHAQSHA